MTNTTTGEAAKAIVRRNTEEVQGKGDFAMFEELFAQDFVDYLTMPVLVISLRHLSDPCFFPAYRRLQACESRP